MRPTLWLGLAAALASAQSLPRLPSQELDAGVIAVKDISYVKEPVEAAKQSLDIYRQEKARKAPVLIFLHGGAWVRGDRKQYPFLGNRFAREGYVVVAPSYRLSPAYSHPAHVEDAAAAVAWTFANIAKHGGDPGRIALAGHSAGAHLATLLASDPRWLEPYKLAPFRLRGVIGLSGVYDLTGVAGRATGSIFGRDPAGLRAASPRYQFGARVPPVLLTYCQFDYPTLPEQARDFHEALLGAGATSSIAYVEGETHVSEILSIVKEGDATVRAMLEFLARVTRK